MEGANDFKLLGLLMLGLLGLMILTGTFFVVGEKFKESICESDGVQVWANDACQVSATNTTAVTITGITQANNVQTGAITLIGFVGLVVIVSVAKVILRITKGFNTGN